MNRKILIYLLVSLSFAAIPQGSSGSVSLDAMNVLYTQNFNTLANVGSSGTVPNGWAFLESGTNANATYTAGNGSSNTGDTYSFGATGSTDRAFGMLQSNTLIPTIGASFTNNTGQTINKLAIVYTGEEWRLGAIGRSDRIDFQYSIDATSLSSGTWSDVDNLDFSTPDTTSGVGPKNGNSSSERQIRSYTITGLNILQGDTIWIRWVDFNVSGNDDGLAIDDFTIIPIGDASVDLIAGGGNIASAMDVGSVSVSDDGTDLTITYAIDTGDWEFYQTHLQVATSLGGIPQVKKGCPIPGQFAYSDAPEDPPTSQTYTIPITDILGSSPAPGLYTIYIAAHAAIGYIDDVVYHESAWGEDIRFPNCKSWATYMTYNLVVPSL